MPGVTPRALVVRPDPASPDDVSERETIGAPTGFEAFGQSLIACAPGGSLERSTGAREEVLFVLTGHGALQVDGVRHELAPESGAYLAPGEAYALQNPGPEPLRLIRVTVPDPGRDPAPTGERTVVRRLADQETQDATTQREFRIVADPSSGLRAATHFVGYIPTARAPEHFHTYDEVIYVLDGEGMFRAGEMSEPLRAGSCIQLPAGTVHCLENTGADTMRVLGVFRPAGSPAAAYYPDGTPAYSGAPPLHTS